MHMLNLDNKLLISDVIAPCLQGLEKTADLLEKPYPNVKIYEIGKVPRRHKTTFLEIFNHLFNNALDHSIEAPDIRVSKGKAKTGKINIDVSRQGDSYEVSFYDDGQGANLRKFLS